MNVIRILLFLLFIPCAFGMTPGIQGHKQGDVIATKTDDQIAAWCDFNKQIVTTDFYVLCIYNGKS
ncbi:hypothetical protein AQUSIP_10250 [Aquicella siphonis]|uniref:Uncharacterized protein n=1 Tax=Aquicella siphonis TaxID=254247 RepID=A0A5E4PHD7_9COXI|nr:hypothetical protein [Aquicella siphonis]VVC75731.1 hypothetical protein AQUSIP_10250 [Aquicella siphonis]